MRGTVLAAISALAAWHLAATFLWIAPPTALRSLVPGGQSTLSAYMLPFFGQSWSVFAPEPINGNYAFRVRAGVDEGSGRVETTEWVNASNVELNLARENLLPPRAANASVQFAASFKSSWDNLSADHKVIVALNFNGESGVSGLRDKLASYGGANGVIDAYMNSERFATAYSTQVALAVWGSGVKSVQWQVSRTNISEASGVMAPSATQPAQVAETGWRAPVIIDGQNSGHFEEVFRSAFLAAGGER